MSVLEIQTCDVNVTASFAPAAETGGGIPYDEFDEVSIGADVVIETLFGK